MLCDSGSGLDIHLRKVRGFALDSDAALEDHTRVFD